MKKNAFLSAFFTFALAIGFHHAEFASAETTAPQRLVYNGHLLDTDGDPVTTAHSVRFSFWKSADFQTGDTDLTGAIDTLAPNYAGWNEVFTLTPNSDGYFSVELGSITPLPDFSTLETATLLSLHMQLEVKVAADPDTEYELMDINPSDNAVDRSGVRSVPFAMNADLLDRREIGTGSGDIAILGVGGIFDLSHIPGGTNSNFFAIDFDDTEGSSVELRFGTSLGKILSYDLGGSYFQFNDSVNIQGDLTVTGLINGIDLSTLSSPSGDAKLRVSSGAGLTVTVTEGAYRLRGETVNYAGSSGNAVAASSTNYVYFSTAGLTINQTGFPTDASIIRLAEVITSGAAVTQVNDRRVFYADDREHAKEISLQPQYLGSAVQGDGSDNIGRLFVDHDAAAQKNFYHWTSTDGALQDYDVLVRHTIPEGFLQWEDGSMELQYRTSSALSADSKVDVAVFDTAGAPVTLSGSVTGLASTSWATTRIEFTGSPSWTPGEDILIRIRTFARNNEQAHAGRLLLRQREIEN